MLDGGDLSALQRAPGEQLDDHGRRGLTGLAHERRRLGHGQVHPRLLDRLQAGDRAAEFGFQGMLVARRLHELRDAQAGILLHGLEADARALRQALCGQGQARGLNIAALDQHGAASHIDLVLDGLSRQHIGHGRHVTLVQAGIYRHHCGRLRPEKNRHAHGHRSGNADQQHELPQAGDLLETV